MSLNFSKLGLRQKESDIARLMTVALQRPDLLSLAAGFTDNQTLPLAELTAMAVELEKEGDRSVLQYGANQGNPRLRQLMSERLQRQDSAMETYTVDRSFVTNGSQQALYLAVQSLCDAGDIVLVEQPTYFVFLEMLRGLGVEAISMPTTSSGEIDTDGLERLLDEFSSSGDIDRLKAVYMISYYANPSGRSVSRASKSAVLGLLQRYDGRIALLEDAAYRELYYSEPHDSESAIALLDECGAVPVLYSTTLTKPFATGLKVGFGYCTHDDWLARMMAIKGQQDFGTANYNQALLAKSLETGLFDRHLAVLRSSYQGKMQALSSRLETSLVDMGWSWSRPDGGLYLWLTAPEGVQTGFDSAFHESAIEAGVMYVPGELCHAEGKPRNRVRLSFGVLGTSELREAACRFCAAAQRFTPTRIS
ncbi:PLP-dependent aminotransferase family protein [Pelagicoccus sp. NFK12]|uniref:PLP-dependent aminotransferase family protein n=1 Tax=Pelagicoccus enzymogenes TaxID=2773457 RepID=A0A927F7V5_9BACT|nr:PLP-dependent aminotransferase family protein [Pelagicoccus enzymogenes]MBD5779336.1 PLP-dependent aminotransferase family protein [Pelagicoccus enzymogenes]